MPNLLIEYTIKLPQGSQENSCFKPVNDAGAKVFHFIQANLSDEMKKTAAYHALERSWVEFVNNSHDAGATRFRVRVLENDASIEIQILDDGHGLPLEKETKCYDWKKAVLAISDKAEEAKVSGKKSCGQHLALSTTAYALERQGGHLAITNRQKVRGAHVRIISPLTPCDSDRFFEAQSGKGNNLIDEMFHVILEKDKNAADQIRKIAGSPDFSGSRNDAARSVLTRIATPSDEAAANGGSPILSTPILVQLTSPAFLRARLRQSSSSSSCPATPLNSPISTGAPSSPAFFSPITQANIISAFSSSSPD